MQYNFENKKFMITGASGGIGKSISKKIMNQRGTLICTASNDEKLKELKNEFGNDHYYYKLDLSDKNNLESNMKKISNDHKDIYGLINNAGMNSDNLFLRMNSEQWAKVIDVNLNSNYFIIKEILPLMVKNRSGVILGIASVVALTGNPGQANYTASKSAIISMYKSIALEVAQRNIRVNVIAPGFIQTAMTDKLNKIQVDTILDKIPQKKLGTPEDVSNAVSFLLSDGSAYITGQTFHINGGMLMV